MRKMYSLKQLEKIIKKEVQKGNLLISGNVEFENDVKIGGDLDITGDAELFENIVDKDGHKRFIEGNIDLANSLPEGVNKIYGKWSLSGSHLLIVICFTSPNTTDLSSISIANVELPTWILNKIVPIGSSVIDKKNFEAVASDNSSQQFTGYLEKFTGLSKLTITTGSFIATKDRVVRISFDLLIDNE